MSYGFDHVMLVRDVIVNGSCHIQIPMYFAKLYIVDAATTFHLELFQIIAPLYVSGISTQSYPDRCQACINVTLYVELFITSIIEKHILIPIRIILTAIW